MNVIEKQMWECQRADGSTFLVEVPSSTRTMFTFEDCPPDQYAPGDEAPDVTVYCKGVRRIA